MNGVYRIRRQSLFETLGLEHTIPANFSATYNDVEIISDNWNRETRTYDQPIPGRWTVVIKPRPVGSRGSAHRIFVVCLCGRLIPTGRLHQHMEACKI